MGSIKKKEEEIGDCSVCYEELQEKGKEVSRIPCGVTCITNHASLHGFKSTTLAHCAELHYNHEHSS